MLKIRLLDSNATLNNFKHVESKEFIPGSPVTIKMQIMDSETKQRLISGVSAKMNVIFQKKDGTELVKIASMLFNPDDRSMWTITLTAVNTNEVVGTNFQVDLDFTGDSTLADLSDATDLRTGMAFNVISAVIFDGEC